jgi:hypothetical protein
MITLNLRTILTTHLTQDNSKHNANSLEKERGPPYQRFDILTQPEISIAITSLWIPMT